MDIRRLLSELELMIADRSAEQRNTPFDQMMLEQKSSK
jgi:hypothetical protein